MLCAHPHGPLLSWARLATADAPLSNDMVASADTMMVVNLWAITHDAIVWVDSDPVGLSGGWRLWRT
jgi:hypothetical protein